MTQLMTTKDVGRKPVVLLGANMVQQACLVCLHAAAQQLRMPGNRDQTHREVMHLHETMGRYFLCWQGHTGSCVHCLVPHPLHKRCWHPFCQL